MIGMKGGDAVFANWIGRNLEGSDVLAIAILVAVVVLALSGAVGEDLAKIAIGGLIGYLSKRAGQQ